MNKTILLLIALCFLYCLTGCSSDTSVLSSQSNEEYLKGYSDGYAAALSEISADSKANSAQIVDNKDQEDMISQKNNDGTYTINSADGTFTIRIEGARLIPATYNYVKKNFPTGYDLVSIRCIVENTNYKGFVGDYVNHYELTKFLRAVDKDGFDCDTYDWTGFDDENYSVDSKVTAGAKARLAFPVIVPSGTDTLTVVIDGTEKITLPIE